MMETNLDSTSYEDLEDGVYNSLSMNQIAAHDTTETLALDEFVQETPNGFQATYTSGCPETYPSTHGRPMFGWKCYNEYISSDENCTYTMCGSRRKYFFWILVKEQTYVEISRVCS